MARLGGASGSAGGPLAAPVPSCAVPGAAAVTGAVGSGKSTLCRTVLAELAGADRQPSNDRSAFWNHFARELNVCYVSFC